MKILAWNVSINCHCKSMEMDKEYKTQHKKTRYSGIADVLKEIIKNENPDIIVLTEFRYPQGRPIIEILEVDYEYNLAC